MQEFQANVALLVKASSFNLSDNKQLGSAFDVLDGLKHIRELLESKRAFCQSGAKMFQGMLYSPSQDVLGDLQAIYQGRGLQKTAAALLVNKYGVLYQMIFRPAVDLLESVFSTIKGVDAQFAAASMVLTEMEQYATNIEISEIHPDDAQVAQATIYAKTRAKRELERQHVRPRRRRNKKTSLEDMFNEPNEEFAELTFE